MKLESHHLSIIYKIFYKAINTLAPKTNITKDEGVTTLFKLNPLHFAYIPRAIRLDEVKLI